MAQGSKGPSKSSGSQHVPVEAANTLRSKSTFYIDDLISEGPCWGLWDRVNPQKCIFYDDVPMMSAEGTVNYPNVTFYERLGSPDQDPIPGFDGVEAEQATAAQEILLATPAIFQVTNPTIDALKIKLRVPSLFQQASNADLVGASIEYKVEVAAFGGPYVNALAISYDRIAFTTASIDNTTGIEITFRAEAVSTLAGTVRTFYNTSYQLQYRKNGGAWSNWTVLVVTGHETDYSQVEYIEIKPGVPIESSSVKEGIIRTFNADALPPGVYEYRVLDGTTVSHGSKAVSEYISSYSTSPVNQKIVGKTVSVYEEQVKVLLPAGGAPWSIKASRLDQESDTTSFSNALFLGSYTEVITANLIYPHCAHVAQKLDSETFGGNVPSRSYDWGGLLVQIPSNYDPFTRIYTGVWDGTFHTQWSDNPAWCLYDMLTNSRYGSGDFISNDVPSKWQLYTIGVYCDELVPDGYGGMEPRFRFNTMINTRQEAYAVYTAMVSVFRGMLFWAAGAIAFSQDAPADLSRLVAPADVVNGEFVYAGSGLKSRHTVALVTWNDPEDGYKPAVELVENRNEIVKRGWIPIDVAAYGCTSRGQAHRLGRWLLLSEEVQTETITYTAGYDHADCTPGEVIAVSDPARAGARMGGRVMSIAGNVLTIDAPYVRQPGDQVLLTLADDTIGTYTLSSSSGAALTLGATPPAISEGAMYIIQNTTRIVPELWRVVGISETDKHLFRITALKHDPNKFALVEQDLVLPPRPVSLFPTGPLVPPTNIQTAEALYKINNQVKTRLVISWTPSGDPRTALYRVDAKVGGANDYINLYIGANTVYEVTDAQAGDWEIVVYALANAETVPSPNSRTIPYAVHVYGKTAPPGQVQNFTAARGYTGVRLDWSLVEDLDVTGYIIKNASDWDDDDDTDIVVSGFVGNSFFVPLSVTSDQTFLIKAVDELGNKSVLPAVIITAINPLPAITGLRAYQIGSQVRLIWDQITGIDNLKYEIRRGDNYDNALIMAKVSNSEFMGPLSVPTQTLFTFHIRAVLELSPTENSQGPISETILLKYPTLNNNIVANKIYRTSGGGWPGFLSAGLEVDSGTGNLVLKDNYDFGYYDFVFTLAAEYFGRCWINQNAIYTPINDLDIYDATGEIDAADFLITPLAQITPTLQIYLTAEESTSMFIDEATDYIYDAGTVAITDLAPQKLFEEADYKFTSQSFRAIFTRDPTGSLKPELIDLDAYFDIPDQML